MRIVSILVEAEMADEAPFEPATTTIRFEPSADRRELAAEGSPKGKRPQGRAAILPGAPIMRIVSILVEAEMADYAPFEPATTTIRFEPSADRRELAAEGSPQGKRPLVGHAAN